MVRDDEGHPAYRPVLLDFVHLPVEVQRDRAREFAAWMRRPMFNVSPGGRKTSGRVP
jgi:hypothetical protein